MRFRVSSKDFTMFIIFCIVLFYLCCLATLNFSSFGATGEFYGLNPFPALSKTYFPATITIFIIALIIIFTSVSSYIFDKEKGKFGLKVGDKEEKGYARWSTDKEMKEAYDVKKVDPIKDNIEAAGVPLVNDGKNIWLDDGENHSLIIGATGSGKTETVVKPLVRMLAKHGESMIITDPKGELYKDSAVELKERGYNIVVLNFRDPQNGNAWNPLGLPFQLYKSGNIDKATELLDDVAKNILYDKNNKGEPFWENSSADFFSGLALGLFEDAKEEEVNLNSISYMSTVGEEKIANSQYIKEYFTLKGEQSSPYIFASNTINAPTETKGGILSVFRQKIRLFAAQKNLSEMLSYSDFEMRNIGKEKTAVFMIIHDEKTTYHGLATIFIKQCYETLIAEAQLNGGKLKNRTNFILDEFVNMPPLKDVTTMITAARSRGIRFDMIIQNFAQLKDVYGAENAETIKGNCGNMIYLITTELAALEEISKLCGEVKSKDKDKTASTPLVTVSDLQKLKKFEVIIKRIRMNPFKTKFNPAFQMDWGKKYESAEFPLREVRETSIFDLKEFVKEAKRAKLFSDMEEGTSKPDLPFMQNDFGFPMPPRERPPMGGMFNPNMDIDEFVKNIDKKIAELEEEERKEKEKSKLENTNNVINDEEVKGISKAEPSYNIYNQPSENTKSVEDKEEKQIEKPKINIDADSIIVDENNVTDDQFFDDFFGDD